MKFTHSFKFIMVLASVLITAACGSGGSPEEAEGEVEGTLTVSAAASLVDALGEATALFNEEYPNVDVEYNFGGSGALMQQITQGAPADLFVSANEKHFRTVMDEGYIDEGNSVDLLRNELVLIVPEESDAVEGFEDLGNADEIAIGNPESVPAGEYSMETFESMDIMEEIESKLIYAGDVRQVLNYVETSNVDAGTVYHTDAVTSDSAEVVDTAPEDSHEPIIYPFGMLNDTDNETAQLAYYEFMQSAEAGEVFSEYGFIVQ